MSERLEFKHKKVQRVRKLVRKRDLREAEGVFVVEGYKLLDEAIKASADIESVFVTPDASTEVVAAANLTGTRVFELAAGVMERISDTVTPQPVLAVIRMRSDIDRLPESASSVLVLDDVRDPGNAGTIIRSAEAAGVGALYFCGGSVDPYNPKTVRSTAGALFHVPILRVRDVTEVVRLLKRRDFSIIGTAGEGGVPYDEADFTRRVAIVLGNEANGMGEVTRGEMDEVVTIPISGRSESLNVSMAAAVIGFEVARQRRAASR